MACARMAVSLAACGGATTPTAPTPATFAPAWVEASWSGGARGAPIDRTAHLAADWRGQLCHASSSYPALVNWNRNPNNLTIINNCTGVTVQFALYVASGSLAQPAGGLRQCATDP